MARLAWLAHDDWAALDQACDVCLSCTEVDLGVRGRAIGLLARRCTPTSPLTRRRSMPTNEPGPLEDQLAMPRLSHTT